MPNFSRRSCSRIKECSSGIDLIPIVQTAPKLSAVPEEKVQRPFYFREGVVSCACPDCGVPMAIRLWLLTADCWRCGTSIDLSFDEVQEARRVLATETAPLKKQAEVAPRKASQQREGFQAVVAKPVVNQPAVSSPANSAPKRRLECLAPPLARVKPPPPPRLAKKIASADSSRYWLEDAEAWLTSLVFHLVVMLLLGLWFLPPREDFRTLVLSLSLDRSHREGGENQFAEAEQPEFDLPIAKQPNQVHTSGAVIPAFPSVSLREQTQNPIRLAQTVEAIQSRDPYRRMHATRDPRLRTAILGREGGTWLTEAAVARALRWIVEHQNPDGSWSFDNFNHTDSCRGECRDPGHLRDDNAGTAIALLALLGTGQTHQSGEYRRHVQRGLAWLLQQQKWDGDLRSEAGYYSGMYGHGLATIALCDALSLTGDEVLREPAQRASEFICRAQHSEGGWRYVPNQVGDTSVVGWQLMALHSARAANLNVGQETYLLAGAFLDSVQGNQEGQYAYVATGPATPAMTAEALLSRMYLGWRRDHPGLQQGVRWLLDEHPPRAEFPDIYYWYYATQVMHHWGGDEWGEWNRAMSEVLLTTQITEGHEAGSWHPHGHPHADYGGRLYVTALSACTLEVYYRYAPLYWQIELD